MNLTFRLQDPACEAVERALFTPFISMQTVSQTRLVNKIGYPGYTDNTRLYAKMTWSGYAEQELLLAFSVPSDQRSSFCRIDYSGTSELDIHGNLVTRHNKILSKTCPTSPVPILSKQVTAVTNPITGEGFDFNIPTYDLGYCWSPDFRCCSPCPTVLTVIPGNLATNSVLDSPLGQTYHGTLIVTDNLNAGNTNDYNALAAYLNNPVQVYGVPEGVINGLTALWTQIFGRNNYAVVLSDEVTDAAAFAAGTTFVSNGSTAENFPAYQRTFGSGPNTISSRFTAVNFALHCTNLMVGRAYVATVHYVSSTGLASSETFNFAAVATTHDIIGTIPNPSSGVWTQVNKPIIAFA